MVLPGLIPRYLSKLIKWDFSANQSCLPLVSTNFARKFVALGKNYYLVRCSKMEYILLNASVVQEYLKSSWLEKRHLYKLSQSMDA